MISKGRERERERERERKRKREKEKETILWRHGIIFIPWRPPPYGVSRRVIYHLVLILVHIEPDGVIIPRRGRVSIDGRC